MPEDNRNLAQWRNEIQSFCQQFKRDLQQLNVSGDADHKIAKLTAASQAPSADSTLDDTVNTAETLVDFPAPRSNSASSKDERTCSRLQQLKRDLSARLADTDQGSNG